jgi:hypothetical protein
LPDDRDAWLDDGAPPLPLEPPIPQPQISSRRTPLSNLPCPRLVVDETKTDPYLRRLLLLSIAPTWRGRASRMMAEAGSCGGGKEG